MDDHKIHTSYEWKIPGLVGKMEDAVPGAADDDGGCSLHSKPFIFETFSRRDEQSDHFMLAIRASLSWKPSNTSFEVVVDYVGGLASEQDLKVKVYCGVLVTSANWSHLPFIAGMRGSDKSFYPLKHKDYRLHTCRFSKSALRKNNNRDDTVTVDFILTVKPEDTLLTRPMPTRVDSLAEKLWESRESTGDIILACGDASFRAHKLVLAAQSDTFAAMFAHHDTKEAQSGKVDIQDMEPRSVEELLHYIYLDKMTSDDTPVEVFQELLVAADKYFISSLKAKCEHELSKELEVGNVCRIGALAAMCNASCLRDSVIQFLRWNFKSIVRDPSNNWDELPPVIAKDVLGLLAHGPGAKMPKAKKMKI